MVCEKEIYEWFKGSVSSQRIDVMCSLLCLCQPLELRFVGSCLEDLARKDYLNFREYELKSNDNSGYTTLTNTATTTEELQNTLNIYVSLLHSTNTVCANSLFHVLEELYSRLQMTFSQGLSGNPHSFGSENSADLLLLFIMAAHHPAFTFSQRIKISEILMSIKQMLSSLRQTKLSQSQKEHGPAARNSVENSSNLVALGTKKAPTIDSYVTVLEMKRNNRNQSAEFLVETNWPDGEMMKTRRSYKDLQMFHEELKKHFSRVLGGESISCYLPQFPAKERNFQNDKQMSDALKAYFRELLSLPLDVTEGNRIRCLVRDLLKKSGTVVVSASATSLPLLTVGKTQTSSSAPSSPHSAFPNASSPSGRTVASRLPNDSRASLVGSVTASQLTSISLQSSQSNDLLESSTRGVSPSHISSSSSQSSARLTFQSVRSRHNSSQGCGSIGAWLKEIRLHKYAAKLSMYSWEELFKLTDADLRKEGFTDGACKKFANEIHSFKMKLGGSLDSMPDSSNSSRPCNLTSSSSSRQSAAPMASVFTKSVPAVSSPGSIDSYCSDYFTPPGSPEPRQSSVNKPRTRTTPAQQVFISSSTVRETIGSDASKSAIVSQSSDTMTSSDVSVVQSISVEASLPLRHTTEPVDIIPTLAFTGDSVQGTVNAEESSDGETTKSSSRKFERVVALPIHESVSVSQALPLVGDMTPCVVDQAKVPVHPGMTVLGPWQVNTQEKQVWPVSRAVAVQPFIPLVGSTDAQGFCYGSRSEGANLAQTHADGLIEQITLHPSGFSPRLPGHPVLDSPVVPPSLPIPSDAVLVRPRLPVGLPPVARVPAIVSPATHFSDVATSSTGLVTDVITKSCSPLLSDVSSNPHFPLQGQLPTVLYPPVNPVSPVFHPPPAINQMIAGTQNKAGYLTPHGVDLPDLTNSSPVALAPAAFSVDHSALAESRPVDNMNQPSGMATHVPGFFGIRSPLSLPASSLPMMFAGMPFPVTDDQVVEDTDCQHCEHYWRMVSYPNIWPVESAFPRSARFSMISPHHGSPHFRPLYGAPVSLQFQNGINPELHSQMSSAYSLAGARPVHTTRPSCIMMPFPQYMYRCHAGVGAMTSHSSCSNCGSSGHSHLECKEQTVESVLGTGHFRLNFIPKTQTG